MIKVIGVGLAIAFAIGLLVAIINTFDNKKNTTILGLTICCTSVFILVCIALYYVL